MSALMPFLVLFAWFGFVWYRRNQRARERWLRRLNLPGSWEWEAGDSALDLSGGLASGSFLLREAGVQRSGRWRLSGHRLELHATQGEVADHQPYVFDLRLFETGKLGLDGPGRERRIYGRSARNVVPMRGR